MPTNFQQSKDVLHPIAFNFVDKCSKINVSLNVDEINAIDFLVRQLISNNLWDKFKAIYPFVGRSEKTHSLNLANTERHNIVWYNTNDLIHNNLGVTNRGAGYGNTMVAPSWFNDNNIHISIYNATAWPDLNSNCPIFGSRSTTESRWMHTITLRTLESTLNASGEFSRPPIFTYSCGSAASQNIRFAGSDAADFQHLETLGYIVGVNGIKCYVNGIIYGRSGSLNDQVTDPINKNVTRTVTRVTAEIPNISQYPFLLFTNGRFTSTTGLARANIRFATIGYELDDNQNIILYKIIQEFQKILKRSIDPLKLKTFEKSFEDFLLGDIKINKIFIYPSKPYREYLSLNKKPKENTSIERITANINVSQIEVFGPVRIFCSDNSSISVSIQSLIEL